MQVSWNGSRRALGFLASRIVKILSLCPVCGSVGVRGVGSYLECKDKDCEVLYYDSSCGTFSRRYGMQR